MNRLLIAGAAVAGVVALAACGGGSGGETRGAIGPSSGTATVSVERIDGVGRVLVDSAGQALYDNDQEASGKVLCTGACTSFWTPLTVRSGTPTESPVTGKLGVIKRPDGAEQVTYNGKLLYSFTEDQPGEVTGDGFADVFASQHFTWHVVHVGNTSNSSGGGGSATGPYGY